MIEDLPTTRLIGGWLKHQLALLNVSPEERSEKTLTFEEYAKKREAEPPLDKGKPNYFLSQDFGVSGLGARGKLAGNSGYARLRSFLILNHFNSLHFRVRLKCFPDLVEASHWIREPGPKSASVSASDMLQ